MKEISDHKYEEGQEVYTKKDPAVKLVVRRYLKRIYYCRFPDDPERQELPLFERELL